MKTRTYKDSIKETTITQPYELTNASYNWSPLMCNIVGVILYHISVKDEDKNITTFGECTKDTYGHYVLDVPVNTLHGDIEGIGKRSRDYKAIVEAVYRLWNSPIKFKAADGSWQHRQIITSVNEKISKGSIKIQVDPETWDYLSKMENYTKFNIVKWLSLNSFYSKRLALLARGWNTDKPIYYKAETLLEMFDLPSNYIIRCMGPKILDPSKKELTVKNDITFDYQKVYDTNSKNGRPKLIGYLLWQIKNKEPENSWIFSETKMIQKMNNEGVVSVLGDETFTTLMKLGFRPENIKNNIFLLYHISLRYNIKTLIEKLETELQQLEEDKNLSFENHYGYYIKRFKTILDKEK